ncbi:MAG: hypothetical protein HY870_20675 [Chloroflexi bacterium]|nr:hypothetical protein [Chloroflexota bacterium]
MAKRSKPSKEKKQAERDRRKRLAAEQKTQHQNQLMRDLAFYADRNLFESEAAWSEAATEALWASQNWRDEPEFAGLAFDIYASGQVMMDTWEQLQIDVEALKQLSDDERDDKGFELHAAAISHVLTPEFKHDFFTRLDRFRQRLRARHEREQLAQAAMVHLVLETSAGSAEVGDMAWAECMLVYGVFIEAVQRFVDLSEAAGALVENSNIADPDVLLDQLATGDSDPQTAALVEKARQTPGLMDFLQHQSDQLIDTALQTILDDRLQLELFTAEDLLDFQQAFIAALSTVRVDLDLTRPDRLTDRQVQRVAESIDNAARDWLDALDEARVTELYTVARQRLTEFAHQSDEIAPQAAMLLPLVADDDDELPGDNDVFVYTLLRQHRRLTLAQTSDSAMDAA